MSDNILNGSTESEQAIKAHQQKFYQNLSVSRNPQQQKNNTNLSMYGAKVSLPISSYTSDSINKMNLPSKLHFSGSQSSLLNSGIYKMLLFRSDSNSFSNLILKLDDDDDYQDTANGSIYDADRSREEKRRISHTAAEQKRRNAIKVNIHYVIIRYWQT